jgi:hypothetical protein
MELFKVRTAVVSACLAVVGGLFCMVLLAGCGPPKEVAAIIVAPGNVSTLNLNRLWGRVAEATGVDAEGATLEQLQLICDFSGTIRLFNFQVFTRDRYFLQFGQVGGVAKASVFGSRTPDGEVFQHSSWSTSLDPVFDAFDRIGVGTMR